MVTISLISIAEAFANAAWRGCFSVTVLMIAATGIFMVCSHYNEKDYWPRKALQIKVLGSFHQWFHITLLITNISCCVWLLGCHNYSPWILAVPLVSYPLSGIILTWATRLITVLCWLFAKSIEYYLKIFQKDWF